MNNLIQYNVSNLESLYPLNTLLFPILCNISSYIEIQLVTGISIMALATAAAALTSRDHLLICVACGTQFNTGDQSLIPGCYICDDREYRLLILSSLIYHTSKSFLFIILSPFVGDRLPNHTMFVILTSKPLCGISITMIPF
jgi:hypothetical protein